MKFNKHTIYIGLFAILYLIVAFSSFWHACAFFGLANNWWMSIILAFAFEVGQAAVLFSLLTSVKDRNRIMPWVLMTLFTLVQVIGNVFSSYKHIITNSVENLRYFKEPIFIWTDLPDQEATVIVTWAIGALLPIASLLLTSMITNYLTDIEENNIIKINSEKGPNPPIDIKNKEDFVNNFIGRKEDENPLINQNSMLHIENQGLQESNKKKDEEINNLKKELEDLKNPKIQQIPSLEINKPISFSEPEELKRVKEDDKEKENSQQGLPKSNMELTRTTEVQRTDGNGGEITTTEDKSNNDDGRRPMVSIEDQKETQDTTPEDPKQQNNEVHTESNGGNPQEIHEGQKIVEESKKPSHFINL